MADNWKIIGQIGQILPKIARYLRKLVIHHQNLVKENTKNWIKLVIQDQNWIIKDQNLDNLQLNW